MKLDKTCVSNWPLLAWVARCNADSITVWHGPLVETGDEWIAEAVWKGSFAKADFDQTEFVVGSGIRLRGNKAHFVSSGTAVDRLWYCRWRDRWYVANTLPGLLAVSGTSLDESYTHYRNDIELIDDPGSLSRYPREIPGKQVPFQLVYFENLCFDGRQMTRMPKPDSAPDFTHFEQYDKFLREVAHSLGENGKACERRRPVSCAVTLSSGYDSTAAAVLARHADCELAVSIENSTSLWRGSDSGSEIARLLGIPCRVYQHRSADYCFEEAVWAAVGRPRGLNLTLFELPPAPCLLFTGNFGDKIWDRQYCYGVDTGDLEGVGLGEFRLLKGWFDCVPAFWGFRHIEQIKAINLSDEMKPWSVGGGYDRPIARRLVEEAGVPRGTFAIRKKNTSSESEFRWPYSWRARDSFARYLRKHGMKSPSHALIPFLRKAVRTDQFLYNNVTKRLGLKWRLRPYLVPQTIDYLFTWANEELAEQYRKAWQESAPDARQSCSSLKV